MKIIRCLSSILVIALSVSCVAFAQWKEVRVSKVTERIQLSGNARLDLLASMQASASVDSLRQGTSDLEAQKKSPVLAGLFSAAVPGAGEIYTKSYWRAAGFLAAEAGMWVVYAAYTKKGNNQTGLFQNYADDHWSVVRYAEWMEQNATRLNPDASGVTGLVVGPPGLPPWDRVDWPKLNESEDVIARKSGNGFTHRLPRRPEQQYYELIGKYPQFAAGWDDAGYVTPDDIVKSNVSPRFLDYSAMRGKANDFYNIASTTASLLVVNHILSALDAAWSASQFNNRVKLEAHLTPTPRAYGFVEFVPTARLQIRF